MIHKTIPYRRHQRWIHINEKLRIAEKYWRWFIFENETTLGKLDKGKPQYIQNNKINIKRKNYRPTIAEIKIEEKMKQELGEL